MWKFLCPIFLPNTVHGFALQKTIPAHLLWIVQKRDRTISVGRKSVVVFNQGSVVLFSTGADSVFALLFKKLLRNFRPSENSTTHRASGSAYTTPLGGSGALVLLKVRLRHAVFYAGGTGFGLAFQRGAFGGFGSRLRYTALYSTAEAPLWTRGTALVFRYKRSASRCPANLGPP